MQYIATEFKGPTNSRGSRIIARASWCGQRVTMPYNHSLNSEGNHRAAAKALAEKLNWHGEWIEGGGPKGNVYVCRPHSHEQQAGFTVQEKRA